ncbi:ATP-binding protein [Streptomyces sp. NPDC005423]|uniref:ATP-binding protein n=1 Tax=Streptomyces sp. NPDC005423 TaxID=3155343 RepID=UPI0033AF4519
MTSAPPTQKCCDQRGFEVSIARCPDPDFGDLSPVNAVWPARLRRIARAALRHWGRSCLSDVVALLLSELVTNALRHAHGDDIGVRLYFRGAQCVIEVRDGSFNRPVLRHAGLADESGRGLFLVDAMAESWGVSDDGTTTWCVLSPPQLTLPSEISLMPSTYQSEAARPEPGAGLHEFLVVPTGEELPLRWEGVLNAVESIGSDTRIQVHPRLRKAGWPGNTDAAARVCGALMDNAARHGKPFDGNVVRLRLMCLKATDELVIEVDDAGPGFPNFGKATGRDLNGGPPLNGLEWALHYHGRLAWRPAEDGSGKTVQAVLPPT